MKTLSGNVYYVLNFPQKKVGFNVSLVYQNLDNALLNSQNIGANAGMNKTFANSKMTTGVNLGWYGAGSGNTLQIGGNISYRLAKKGALLVNASWQQTTLGNENGKKWSKLFGSSGISFSF